MATWREEFTERIKIPAIGTNAWFECCDPGPLRSEAERLVKEKRPVIIERSASKSPSPAMHLVKFEGTDFVACGFNDPVLADEYASAWNRLCA